MTNVPNPFKVIDDVLMDNIFNPISWWSVNSVRRDAVYLGTVCAYGGTILVMGSLIVLAELLMAPVAGYLCGLSCRRRKYARRDWQSNNRTGKNRIREFKWINRSVLLVMFFTFSVFLLVLPVDKTNFPLWTAQTVGHLWIVFICGMWLVNVLPEYFDATDNVPPRHVQFKTVSQI